MLSRQSAIQYFDRIFENDQSGNCAQKILGLRQIFDRVLCEMYPDISEQGFYQSAIDQIFSSSSLRPNESNSASVLKSELHNLRKYLNNIQHSKIESDLNGYLQSIGRLAIMVSFCSGIPIPHKVCEIFKKDVNRTIVEYISKQGEINNDKKEADESIFPTKEKLLPTLVLIVDKNSIKTSEISSIVEREIGLLRGEINGAVERFIVASLSEQMMILSLPIESKKYKFQLHNYEVVKDMLPLKNYIANAKLTNLLTFYLAESTDEVKFSFPDFLSISKIKMTIGVVCETSTESCIKDNLLFDKFVKIDNLNLFFDWIHKVIANYR